MINDSPHLLISTLHTFCVSVKSVIVKCVQCVVTNFLAHVSSVNMLVISMCIYTHTHTHTHTQHDNLFVNVEISQNLSPFQTCLCTCRL